MSRGVESERKERRHDEKRSERKRTREEEPEEPKRTKAEGERRQEEPKPQRDRVSDRREREQPPVNTRTTEPAAETRPRTARPTTAERPAIRPPGPRPPLGGRGRMGGRGMMGRGFGGRGPVQVPRKEINRQEVCPLLLRVFVSSGEHHKVEQFSNKAAELVDDEVQIYTWKDATLLELTQLIQRVKPFAKERNAQLHFNLVAPNKGKFVHRHIGTVRAETSRRSEDDRKTLQDTKFEIGDYLDVAVMP
eukprot:NODE_1449_length_912_cov_248.699884_g1119_i0.p1 GENE.NODE_1449_length_912_cov_248.699884_g1119_i0~~NODE_1449_length_912_cov_248.699884_g1119_i0.p1  ORF type:complete len:249 (-),score=47.86 NODE_1449_length_912_cov_248.699884_g1119_i0:97-843(-)